MRRYRYNGAYGKAIGERNRAAIEEMLKRYPGIRGKEIAKKLGLNVSIVSKHIQKIRETWL